MRKSIFTKSIIKQHNGTVNEGVINCTMTVLSLCFRAPKEAPALQVLPVRS